LKTDGSGNLTWSSVDAAGTDNSTAVTLATVTDNYLTIDGQEITAGNVPLTLGGTGATDAPGARTNLGLGTIATQASDAVNIDGGAIDGTIIGANTPSTGVFTSVNSGLVQSVGDTDIIIKTGNDTTGTITLANGADGNINISPNGTGQVVIDALKFPAADGTTGQVLKTDGSGNLTWSSVDAAGTDNSTAVSLAEVTDNYLTITGQEITAGTVPLTLGGTGATDAAGARTALGVDAAGTDNSTAVSLAEVTDNYLTITGQEITAGNVPLTLGGTGATDAAGARTNLGLGTIATQASDAVNIDGGAIDGTIIGANTPSTGVFTSVNSGLVQSVGDTDIIIKTGNDTTGTITLANGADGNINISPNGTGKVVSDNTDLTGTTRLAGTTITASGLELNALDGDNTAQSITVESADRIVINDDGTMKQIAVSTVGAFLISSSNLQLNSLTDVVDSGEASNFGNSLLIGTGSYSGSGSTDNTGVGTQALDALTTGDDNTALGYNALTANTEGSDNIGIGQNALKANTTGNDNIALGSDALSANISGNNNLSIGLNSLKTGNYVDGSNDFSNNVTLGNYALEVTTTGSDNTSIGYRTGDNNTTGKSNVFIGSNAGDTNTIGEENVIIGTDADTGAINAINRIVIGDDASGSVNNTAVIGNDSVTDVYMSQDSGATVHADGVKFYEDTANGTNYVGFNSAASLAGNQVWTLPTADGSANQVLKTDGNGILSWNSDSDSGSLVQITENSKTGYRLSGVDSANYADIGTDAVDLSYSETSSAYNGAKGNYSFAVGFETMALGYKSFAAGSKVTASGNLSTAFGDQTSAGAVNSTTFGTGTTAKDFSSFIIGSYNSVGSTTTVNGSLSSYDSDNSAFVIGNGADSSNKSDAFIVYSNGNTAIAGTLTLGGAFTVPASIGSSGQVLKVPSSGSVLEWGSAGGASSIDDLTDALIEVNSIYVGNDPSSTTNTAEKNTALGLTALDAITTGDNNVAIGYDALTANTEGSENVAVGRAGLSGNTSGANNVSIGNESLSGNTEGDRNTAVGFKAMFLNQTGQRNAALGYLSGKSGSYNAGFGAYSLNAVTGDSNTAVGYYAGSGGNSNTAIVTGTNNVLIGRDAGVDDDDAENRIVIGKDARGLDNNTVTLGNGFITNWLPTDDSEVDLGSSSKEMKDIYVDGVAYLDAIGLGTTAFSLPTSSGSDGQILAKASGTNTFEWVNNSGVAGGINDLSDAFFNSSDANLVVGHIPGNITSGTSNSAFSNSGLMDLTSGLYNNVFGSDALASLTTGWGNTAMGHKTMQFLVDGDENTGFGQGALYTLTSGSNNTAVGVHAGRGNQTGRYNTSVGQESLDGTGNNSSNTAVGFRAGKGITTGSDNVFIGKNAGYTIDDGSSNVVIGDDADVSATNSSNQIVIGQGATGTTNNTVLLGNGSITNWLPTDDDEVSLGSSNKEMHDIYVDGVAYLDAIGLGTTAFSLPTSSGSDGQILAKASGTNTFEWVNNSGVAGGINDLSDAVINGGDNSSVGLGTSLGNGVGRRNVGVGIGSLSSLTGDAGDVWSDAINNTAVGYNALNSLTTGVQNTIMGAENSGSLTGDKNVVLGAQLD